MSKLTIPIWENLNTTPVSSLARSLMCGGWPQNALSIAEMSIAEARELPAYGDLLRRQMAACDRILALPPLQPGDHFGSDASIVDGQICVLLGAGDDTRTVREFVAQHRKYVEEELVSMSKIQPSGISR